MVKILSLIGMIFTGIGFALQLIVYTSFNSPLIQFFELGSINYISTYGISIILLFNALIYLGMILIFISGFFKGNIMLIISGIICIIGSILQLVNLVTYSNDYPYYVYGGTLFLIGGFALTLGMLLYFIGLIGFRKKNKVAWIFGLLLFAIVTASNVYFNFVSMLVGGINDTTVSLHLSSYIVQTGGFTLYGFVFFFSKRKIGWESDKVEDTMSVSSGSAFASYVPDEPKAKKKKTKKSGGDDFAFNF